MRVGRRKNEREEGNKRRKEMHTHCIKHYLVEFFVE